MQSKDSVSITLSDKCFYMLHKTRMTTSIKAKLWNNMNRIIITYKNLFILQMKKQVGFGGIGGTLFYLSSIIKLGQHKTLKMLGNMAIFCQFMFIHFSRLGNFNQDLIKVPKFLSQRMCGLVYKTLGSKMIKSPHSFIITFSSIR